MAAEIERELGLATVFVAGSGGVFDVHLGGELIFTNRRTGGVPDAQPVLEALRYALGHEESGR